ncbi:acetyl-CoA synthetase-like protein [Ramaria rubella]|nr:acetyl-CoA synthetase-like protein [Ramaria rubella]
MPNHPDIVPIPSTFDYTNQSVEIPGTRRPGQTGIYRNAAWPELLNYNSDHARSSLYDVFQSGLARSPNEPCLGYRPIVSTNPLKFAPSYSWQTYTQVDERRRNVGSALAFLWQQGLAGGGDLPTIGLWSQNRPEWQVVDLAVQAYAKVSVSLYDTLGADAVEYICNHAEISVVFVSALHVPSVLGLSPRLKNLKVVVSLDEPNEETKRVTTAWAKHRNLEFFSLLQLESLGKANLREPIVPTPQQVYSICYTSGTTGNPKGVLLTHGQCSLAVVSLAWGIKFTEPGILFSYLPLAHVYGRILELVVLNLGGSIGYFTGDPLRLLEDAQVLKPTSFPAVPRVMNKIYQAVNAAGDVPGFKGDIFRKAVAAKLDNLRSKGQLTHAIWDRVVFKKIQRVLGGRVEHFTVGSAPISRDVIDFLKVAFSCDIYEGYGMTETATICTRTIPNDLAAPGSVGPPMPASEIKLVDVPALGYTSQDKPGPRGELCSRGLVNFSEYYKDPKNTSQTIDQEGWLHTGDVAERDIHGRFKIIDRVKNIMKLAQGEYVALERIENAYSVSPIIGQIYVHGESLQDYLVAIVVPDMDYLAGLASKLTGSRVSSDDHAALLVAAGDERVKAAIMAELAKQAQRMQLKGFESVKNIHISLEPFTSDNGTLTPTLKLKRVEVQRIYKKVLGELYKQPLASTSEGFKL